MTVRPAGNIPGTAPPGAQPVQLPPLSAVQTQGLTRAAASGNVASFMAIANRARLTPDQAMAFLQQYAQQHPQAATQPRFQALANAVNQKVQAQRAQQAPPQPPGSPQPGEQRPGGGIADLIVNMCKGIMNFLTLGQLPNLFGPNAGQQPPQDPQQAAARRAPQPRPTA